MCPPQQPNIRIGDANHKPEIAVALSQFEVFVGWKPLPEIQSLFTGIPSLNKRFIHDKTDFNHETLKKLVGQILSLSDEDVTSIYNDLRETPTRAFGNHDYIPEVRVLGFLSSYFLILIGLSQYSRFFLKEVY